jgi:zinc transport system substrate-binding protein
MNTRRRGRFLGAVAMACVAAFAAGNAAAAPRVMASIQPIHSLVAGVMQGVGAPGLIVQGYASPHAYQMRPSVAAALYQADLVFWMGAPLENFLQKPINNVRPPARVVTLLDTQGLNVYFNRKSGVWDAQTSVIRSAKSAQPAPAAFERDPHVWLSPQNAKHLVDRIAMALAKLDADNAARYRTNAGALSQRIDRQTAALQERLAPVRSMPFVTFHDAFQYFERAFGLNAVGALHLQPDRAPGAGRIYALRAAIRAQGVRCVFREPQFQAALVDTLVEGTGARVDVLDSMGAAIAPGPNAWFQMMAANADSMVRCLGG